MNSLYLPGSFHRVTIVQSKRGTFLHFISDLKLHNPKFLHKQPIKGFYNVRGVAHSDKYHLYR